MLLPYILCSHDFAQAGMTLTPVEFLFHSIGLRGLFFYAELVEVTIGWVSVYQQFEKWICLNLEQVW